MSFVAPSSASVDPQWIPCRTEGDTLACDAALKVGPDSVVKKITYSSGDPAESRLLLAHSGGAPDEEVPPAAVIIAPPEGIKDIPIPSAPDPTLGLLVDRGNARVIVASPWWLRSTYSRLVYLDGGSGTFFTKVYGKMGFWGEQVTLWKINWRRLRQDDEPPR
jgi:hypothetical protein